MNVDDYYPQGKRWWARLPEKRGKVHELPAHYQLEGALDAYLDATDLWEQKKGPDLPHHDGRRSG